MEKCSLSRARRQRFNPQRMDSKRMDSKRMDAAVNYWLKLLERSGIDLEAFGLEEARMWRDLISCESKLPYMYMKHLMGFSYGKDPQDWHMWMREPSDVFAGDFWAMIERRIEIMPGTWPEQ